MVRRDRGRRDLCHEVLPPPARPPDVMGTAALQHGLRAIRSRVSGRGHTGWPPTDRRSEMSNRSKGRRGLAGMLALGATAIAALLPLGGAAASSTHGRLAGKNSSFATPANPSAVYQIDGNGFKGTLSVSYDVSTGRVSGWVYNTGQPIFGRIARRLARSSSSARLFRRTRPPTRCSPGTCGRSQAAAARRRPSTSRAGSTPSRVAVDCRRGRRTARLRPRPSSVEGGCQLVAFAVHDRPHNGRGASSDRRVPFVPDAAACDRTVNGW